MNKQEITKSIEDFFAAHSARGEDYRNNPEDYVMGISTLEIEVSFHVKKCSIHLSKMYQGLGNLVSFQNLTWLSKLLNTDKINLVGDHFRRGCDTCDYGSQQEITIVCHDIVCDD